MRWSEQSACWGLCTSASRFEGWTELCRRSPGVFLSSQGSVFTLVSWLPDCQQGKRSHSARGLCVCTTPRCTAPQSLLRPGWSTSLWLSTFWFCIFSLFKEMSSTSSWLSPPAARDRWRIRAWTSCRSRRRGAPSRGRQSRNLDRDTDDGGVMWWWCL